MLVSMIKPNLIIPGAPKSGTSSLHEYLNLHPQINMSQKVKEPHIYSIKERYDSRFDCSKPRSFCNIFTHSENTIYYGESSTTYLISKEAPLRIYKDNPDIKFIIILRDPIERIISHYNWLYSFNVIKKNFLDEIKEWDEKSFNSEIYFNGNYKNYIEFSEYGKQLENYLNYFDLNQLLILETKELKEKPLHVLNRCFNFLGLKKLETINVIEKNKTKISTELKIPRHITKISRIIPTKIKQSNYTNKIKQILFQKKNTPPPVNDKDIKWLQERLAKDIDLLRNLTGKAFESWTYF